MFSLTELRKYLGVVPDEYAYYGSFKVKLLKVAQRELKNKTDISFNFQEIKTGKRVTEIKITIIALIPDMDPFGFL